MGMLICIVIAFAVTLGGFAILRRQMAKTDLEETKEQSYEAHYAFIVDNPEDEYWKQVYEAAKEEGKKQNIYVEQIFENVSQTYETKEYMDIAIAEKVDGILLQSSSKSVGPEMNAAMEAGIPVVTMLHDNYSGRRCAFVGVNDSSLGESYAELIQENISKKKKDVLLLMEKNGDLGESNLVLQTIRRKVQGAAIIDGNVTTLIAAVVLYIKGSGTVMGFAQTLAIGIILSMFTAIFVTRWILYAFVGLGLDDVKFYGIQKTRKPINFVGNIKKYAIISGCLLLLCIGGLVMNMVKMGQPLNYSLEFLGGSSTSITFTDYKGEGFDASGIASEKFKNEVTDVVKSAAGVSEAEVSDVKGEKTLIVRTPAFTEDQQKKVISAVEDKYEVSDKSIEVETISASVSNEMRTDAIVAVLIAAVGMLIYIWIRFKNLAFGASSVIALLHDVMVVLMVYAIGSASITVGSTFIACMLTIVGYSINATIVVFDRVRENRKKLGNTDLAEIVNTSITETLSRSFNTSITTLVMVLCLAVLGVDSIRQFAVPMMAGIISGCYSSVCLAGTVWYFMNRSAQKKAKAKKAGNKKK